MEILGFVPVQCEQEQGSIKKANELKANEVNTPFLLVYRGRLKHVSTPLSTAKLLCFCSFYPIPLFQFLSMIELNFVQHVDWLMV